MLRAPACRHPNAACTSLEQLVSDMSGQGLQGPRHLPSGQMLESPIGGGECGEVLEHSKQPMRQHLCSIF